MMHIDQPGSEQTPLPDDFEGGSVGAKPPYENSPLGQLVREHEIVKAVLDVDMTLVDSRKAHIELQRLTASSLGFDQQSLVDEAYSGQKGQSYDVILREVHGACEGAGLACNLKQYTDQFYSIVGAVRAGTVKLSSPIRSLEGADEIVKALRALGVEMVAASGSPRPIVEMCLTRAGIMNDLKNVPISCFGDTELTKRDPQYWDGLLGDVPRDRIIALDDHPQSARKLLEVARVGRVLLRPSVDSEALSGLITSHKDKIVIVGEWSDLL